MVGDAVGGEDGDVLVGGAEGFADDEGAVDAAEHEGEFGGAGAGCGEDGDLGVGAAEVGGAAQAAAVRAGNLGVLPGHAGAGEGGGDGGDCGEDFEFEAVLGAAQGADDAEEAGVALGDDDGGAAVFGDPAGGELDAAEGDAFGGGRHREGLELVGGAGHQGGCGEGRGGGLGERCAVPPDDRDPVSHLWLFSLAVRAPTGGAGVRHRWRGYRV